MKIAIICRSDSTGGAAIVSRRLTEALRKEGEQATMLVLEKRSGKPYVVKADYPVLSKLAFLLERLRIFIANGFSRKNLFKADTGQYGVPLKNHPVVKDADAVILNWVNQGMLSLREIAEIAASGKRVVWTMHDMWNLTGICHHAMDCHHYREQCGHCFLLGRRAGKNDLSRRVHQKKETLYAGAGIRFVAVSNWLAGKAAESSLLAGQSVTVIPNPFDFTIPFRRKEPGEKKRILFAAATLDNWIKGLDTFRQAVKILREEMGASPENTEIAFLGAVKNPENLEGFALPAIHLGTVTDEIRLAEVYGEADVVASCSSFENLPGVLVEGQAYGAVPVAFDRGGQADIIDHLQTGYLAEWNEELPLRARNIAEGIKWALRQTEETRERMRRSAEERFAYGIIAKKYTNILDD